jgi:predicted TIM-barrel fold metal-dependent hydrolase
MSRTREARPVGVDGFRVLDADAHVVEPPEVFGSWSSAIDLPEDTPMVPCGDLGLIEDQLANGFDAPSYLRGMDAQGIDAVVLYPSIGLFVPFQPDLDARQSAAACRSYNEWIAAYCAEDPGRMFGVGLVPLVDVDLAVAEAQAADGLLGMLARPNHLYGRNLGDPAYDPLYAFLAEAGLVLAVHEGLGLRGPTIGADRFTSFTARHLLSHPMEQMAAMASLVLDGALDRHPTLKVAFLESGTGWLPYWLHRLDEHLEWAGGGRRPASQAFAEQCVISTEADDDLVGDVIGRVGADHVLWASDFPHPDALFPDAATSFVGEARRQGVSDEDLATVLWDAPLDFYRLADRLSPST